MKTASQTQPIKSLLVLLSQILLEFWQHNREIRLAQKVCHAAKRRGCQLLSRFFIDSILYMCVISGQTASEIQLTPFDRIHWGILSSFRRMATIPYP